MGVVFLMCDVCGKTFPDCGPFLQCYYECSRLWCSEKCADEDDFKNDDDYDVHFKSCKYCRKEDVDDSTLLEFFLDKNSITREEAVEDWKKNRKSKIFSLKKDIK